MSLFSATEKLVNNTMKTRNNKQNYTEAATDRYSLKTSVPKFLKNKGRKL